MRFPNKLYSYSETTIALFPVILQKLTQTPYAVNDLYKTVAKKMNVIDFLEVLDCLFALGKIEYDAKREMLYICCTK